MSFVSWLSKISFFQTSSLLWYLTSNFNPHSRKGSDADVKELDPYSIISIHTPARGVTKLLLIVLFSA